MHDGVIFNRLMTVSLGRHLISRKRSDSRLCRAVTVEMNSMFLWTDCKIFCAWKGHR